MLVKIEVPQQGLTTEYVTFRKWIVKEGQKVSKNMPIAEIESEKVTLEIECPVNGVVSELIAKENEELTINQVMGYIETEV